MRFICLFALAIALSAQTTAPAPDASKGLPPRASAAEYQGHAKAGNMTIAADFTQHAVSTAEGTLTTEDYVVVEVALFGDPGARTTVTVTDFSLRINGNKKLLPSVPYGMVVANLKDPDYVAPEEKAAKEKKSSSLSTGGDSGGGGNDPPPIIHIPLEVQRSWAKRVQTDAIPEGDRPLPIAGLIFFHYTGRAKNVRTVDLVYAGPAGKSTVTLAP